MHLCFVDGVRGLAAAGQLALKISEHQLNAQAHGLTDASPLTTSINAHADHVGRDSAVIMLAFKETQECPLRMEPGPSCAS